MWHVIFSLVNDTFPKNGKKKYRIISNRVIVFAYSPAHVKGK